MGAMPCAWTTEARTPKTSYKICALGALPLGMRLCVQKLSMHSCFTARASHFFKADLKVVVPPHAFEITGTLV
jgi:hypothetical protein